MKLKILMAAMMLLALSTAKVNAQSFHLGLEGGMDTASFENSNASNIQGNRVGFVGGGFLQLSMPGLSIQPEVLFIQKGASTLDGSTTFEFDYIEVPVLAKISLGLPILDPALLIGPYMSFYTGSQATNGVITNPSSTDVGGVFGAELNVESFSLSARWELGVTHVTTDTNISNRDVIFLLGYSFI